MFLMIFTIIINDATFTDKLSFSTAITDYDKA